VTSPCPAHDTLVSLIDGELAETRARAVRAHVESCARCRAALGELEALVADLRAPVPDALGQSPEAFADEVLARLASRPARSSERRSALLGRAAPFLAAAACVALAVGVGWRATSRRAADAEFSARGAASLSAPDDDPRRTLVRFGRVRDGVFEPILDGAHVRADDILVGEVGATEGAQRYLLAFVVDAAGERHWLYPAWEVGAPRPVASALPRTASPRVLGTMVRLEDPAPGPAQLVAIVLRHAESVDFVEQAPASELTRERLAARYPDALISVTRIVVEVR